MTTFPPFTAATNVDATKGPAGTSHQAPVNEPAREWEVCCKDTDVNPFGDVVVEFIDTMTFAEATRRMLDSFEDGHTAMLTGQDVCDGRREFHFDLIFAGKVFGFATISEVDAKVAEVEDDARIDDFYFRMLVLKEPRGQLMAMGFPAHYVVSGKHVTHVDPSGELR